MRWSGKIGQGAGLPATRKRDRLDFKAKVALDALEEALSRCGKPGTCDTDQDSQFTSFAFTVALASRRDRDQHGWPGALDGQCL